MVTPRFRRPVHRTKHILPDCYYRICLLEDIEMTLDRLKDDALIKRFQIQNIRTFIRWSPGTATAKYCIIFYDRAVSSTSGIWFHIRGRNIEYTIQDHVLVTRLRFGPTHFYPTHLHFPSQSQLFHVVCWGHLESVYGRSHCFMQTRATKLSKRGDSPPTDEPVEIIQIGRSHR